MGNYNDFDKEPSMDEISLTDGAANAAWVRGSTYTGGDTEPSGGTAAGYEYSEADIDDPAVRKEFANELYETGIWLRNNGRNQEARSFLQAAFKNHSDRLMTDPQAIILPDVIGMFGKISDWRGTYSKDDMKRDMCMLASVLKARDDVKAFKYYKMAEGVNTTERLYQLGCLYCNGKGIKINFAEAIKCYKRVIELAKKDDRFLTWALNNLGVMYEGGQGCERDVKKAMGYYSAAAELGSGTAAYNLARLYEKGYEGIEKNMYLAYLNYKKAAELGNEDAKQKLKDSKWEKYKLY